MKTLNESDFLRWADQNELGLDERYPQSAVLHFRPNPELARCWEVRLEPERRPYFIASMLELMGDWQACYVWRNLGSWPQVVEGSRINDVVEWRILKGLGLPLGTTDVVELSRNETDTLVTLMFSTTIFGWSVGEDLYVVPNHARHVLKVSHHDVIHAHFRFEEDLERYVKGMDAREFALPESVPDRTFKQPSWMKEP